MGGPLFTLGTAAAAGAILVGISARLRVPSIALLLLGGVLLGPEGAAIIDPASLGSGLKLVVGMAVAVILFEGGLTLDVEGARRSSVVISRMLTVGVLITWIGTSAAIWWLFEPEFEVAVLCGSLVVVTGPTVVSPILRRISVRDRIKHILYWESVLVDAIGVFLAVLCFEWITPDADHGTWSPVLRFCTRVGVGVGAGLAVGLAVAYVLRKHLIHDEHGNIFVLGTALFTFAVCESVLHESGVLAVIVAGFVVGVSKPQQLQQLKRFKLELTEFGVGALFVLLAGTLRLEQFTALGWELLLGVGLLTLVIRPVAIFVSAWRRNYSLQEKVFLSWVAPRGIVAAFLASLFAFELGANANFTAEAELLHTFTFAVIGTTVILQGLSAPMVARMLGLQKEPKKTWLIVGERAIAEPMAAAVNNAGGHALGLGRVHDEEREADTTVLIHADPLDRSLFDDPRFADVTAVVAISPNVYFNELICDRWAEVVGKERCFHWSELPEGGTQVQRLLDSHVWSGAGTPSDLLARLETGSLRFGEVALTDDEPGPTGKHLIPLFRVRDGETTIAGDRDTGNWLTGDTIITMRQPVRGLAGLVRDVMIVSGGDPELGTVVHHLLERARAIQDDLPVDELQELIIGREASMPTAMGAGVAIPHAYHETVTEPQCFVANVRAGIAAATPDGQPIRLVFLVLSPKGQAEAHLKSLATIANLCSDSDYLALLESEESEDGLLRRIEERE